MGESQAGEGEPGLSLLARLVGRGAAVNRAGVGAGLAKATCSPRQGPLPSRQGQGRRGATPRKPVSAPETPGAGWRVHAGPATLSASFTDIRNRDKNNALFVARAEFPIVLVNEGDGSLFFCGGSPDCSSELVGAFYGLGHEEVAGTVTWDGGSDGSAFGFVGAFGAKRQ